MATTGTPASFTIQLVAEAEDGNNLHNNNNNNKNNEQWNLSNDLFIYVWIAGEDQIFIAEVVNNSNNDDDNDNGGKTNNGTTTLTATYQSSFPGEYLIYVEEVRLTRHDEGRPIQGSPFSLTVAGAPTHSTLTASPCAAPPPRKKTISRQNFGNRGRGYLRTLQARSTGDEKRLGVPTGGVRARYLLVRRPHAPG